MADNKKIFTDLLKELEPTDEFYQETVDEAKKNLSSNEIGYYPSKMVGAYKVDLQRVEKAYLRLQDFTFKVEPETVTKSDIARIEKDWDRLETCCFILHSQNAMFTGHIEQRFASIAFTTVKLINGVVQVQKIKEVNDVSGNGVQVISEMSMEIEGQERPAMVAEFISLSFA